MRKVQQRDFYIALSLVGGLILFHLSILLQWIEPTYVWLGKLKEVDDIVYHELISLYILGFVFMIIVINMFDYFKKVAQYIYAVYAVLFFLNAIANIFANSIVEQYLFTSLCFYMSVLFFNISRRLK